MTAAVTRAFVAVRPGAAQLGALREPAERLARAAGGALRPVPERQLHLTLAFLGDVPTTALDAIAERAADVAAAHVPFELALGGLGAFPDRARPRVVWVGVTAGAEPLGALAEELRRALAPLAPPLDERPFRAHLTLGRARGRRDALAAALARAGPLPPLPPARVRGIELVTSRPTPAGAEHRVHRRLPLGGPASAER